MAVIKTYCSAKRSHFGGQAFACRIVGLSVAFCVAVVAVLAGGASSAIAEGPNAILTPTGYNTTLVPRGDDTYQLAVNLPFTMNWNGTNYTQIYINMNGNCTFGSQFTTYNPSSALSATNQNILAPFWADVNTANAGTAQVSYSRTSGAIPQVNGRNAFFVNWVGVSRYNQATPTNSFQLVIVDRSDTGAGNFDFMFNYDKVEWDIATTASTTKARVGWAYAQSGGASFELPGSGVAQSQTSALLDSSASATSLIQNSLNSNGQLGRYVWQVRGGTPNVPPQLTVVDRVLEGNAPGAHLGYMGTDDATATDPDGTVTSLVHDRSRVLPLGTTGVTWVATDNRGLTTSALQSIVVADTTSPTTPSVGSSTHVTGTWSTNRSVNVQSTGSTDVCAGVEACSYSWSQNAPATPDATADSVTSTDFTASASDVIDRQTFPNSTWPSDWARSGDTSYLRLTNATGRHNGTYAAEVYANNTTRRTAEFTRDFDLKGYTSATLSFWNNVSKLSQAADYSRVHYSTNGGSTWTQLATWTGPLSATGWQQRQYSLPVGGTVRVRFSASVNANGEYANWDDIEVTGVVSATQKMLSVNQTQNRADGRWYFNVRTVDAAGNWSQTASLGPVMVDTVPPVTTDNAPTGWSTTPVDVVLTATDAGDIVSTVYSVNGGSSVTYTGPIPVSAQGTTTIRYRSTDAAGHVEEIRTATVRIDSLPPTRPGDVDANATSISEIEVTWSASTDTGSGVARYEVYRNGVLAGTSTTTSFIDSGLTAGKNYSYHIVAVDVAGNRSPVSRTAEETVPTSSLWLVLTPGSVDMGALDPGSANTVDQAAKVTVGGVGAIGYELSCSAEDFRGIGVQAPVPTLPVGALSYSTGGFITLPMRSFQLSAQPVSAAKGSRYRWSHEYVFSYQLSAPWDSDAGEYATTVTYTAVSD